MNESINLWGIDPTLIVAIATFIVASLTFYRMISRPRVKIYFWDKDTDKCFKKIVSAPGNLALRILFRNEGDLLRLWKPAATMLSAFIYFDKKIKITEIRRSESPKVKSNEVFQASPSGRFANRANSAIGSSLIGAVFQV